MDATGFWDHLPVVFTVPKLVLCVDVQLVQQVVMYNCALYN